MNILLFVLITLLIIRLINKKRVDLLTLDVENKILSLRQSLIDDYLSGKIDSNQNLVLTFNNLLVRASTELPNISLWVILYAKKRKLIQRNVHLDGFLDELHSSEGLRKYYINFSELLTGYLFKKSIFSWLAMNILLFVAKRVSKRCLNWLVVFRNKWKSDVMTYQETMTPTV